MPSRVSLWGVAVLSLLAAGPSLAPGQQPKAPDSVPQPAGPGSKVDPIPVEPPAGAVIPVQLPEVLRGGGAAGGGGAPAAAAADAPSQLPSVLTEATGAAKVAATAAPPVNDTTSGTNSAVRPTAAQDTPISGGTAAATLNAPDAGDLLNKSSASVGAAVQRRNAIVSDPRVRGWRPGQYLMTADGGLFAPARSDIDTPLSKYDSGSVRDIILIKGPYSALYGPGFSFLDVATLDAPRYEGFQVHGRTALGYQTNGKRWDALQSVSTGDRDWGFRMTYDFLQGNDYEAGDGTLVPASYLSHNVNFALGLSLSEKSVLQLKGLRVRQSNLEFPGLYFDITQLDTEAYSLRYAIVDQGIFDKFTFDVWYNNTTASGDTHQGAKQAFVQQLLAQSFNPQLQTRVVPVASLVGDPQYALFRDASDTRFAGRSIGYRAAAGWGPKDDPFLTVGHDLNVFGQGLVENIRIEQYQGPSLASGRPVSPSAPQTFTQTQQVPQSNQVDPGLFAQVLVPVSDRLKIRTGGRLDWVHSSSNPRPITGNIDLFGVPSAPGFDPSINRQVLDPIVYSVDPTVGDLSRDYFLPSVFLRTEYKLGEHWTALAGVGYARRAPTLTELYAAGPFIGVLQQGTSRLIGDPNLSPEKLTQFDIGLTADYKMVQAGVNAFYAKVQDYITYDANKTGLGLTQVVYTNTDRASLAGVELYGQLEASKMLSPFATLSYVQGWDETAADRRRAASLDSSRRDDPLTLRRKAESEPLPQIPPLESRLGLRIHAPTPAPAWQVELSARIVTGQNNVASSLGELATPGFTVFTVRGYWRVTENLLVTAGAENIGNKTYREHLDPISGNLLGVGPLFRPGTNFFFNTQFTY